MITLNKEILLHPDFTGDLENELCEMLEALIDAEFEKGDNTDFDFIDECADAINAIRSGDMTAVLPVISRRDFIKKVSGSSNKSIKTALAVCAALAVIFGANAVLSKTTDVDIISEVYGFFSEFFTHEAEPIETTTAPAVTETTTQTSAPEIIGISVEKGDNFKSEYYVGESFTADGITVFAEYDNGERKILDKSEYRITVNADFGSAAKYEPVTVEASGLREHLEVRVINSISTKKLSSVYAIFPDDFTFTADDLDNINLDKMQVFAVYSDGSERELSADEYEIVKEIEKNLFEEYATITVGFESCSCSFMVFKE